MSVALLVSMHHTNGPTLFCENNNVRLCLASNPPKERRCQTDVVEGPRLPFSVDDGQRRRSRPEEWARPLSSSLEICFDQRLAPLAIASRAFSTQRNPAEAFVLRAVAVRDVVGNIRRISDGLPRVRLQAAETSRVRGLRVLR